MQISHVELEDYIGRFKEHQRELVAKQILDSQIIEKALETTQGKLLLNNAIDIITSNLLEIVNKCCHGDLDDIGRKVYPHAFEMHVAFKMLTSWATILSNGNKHKAMIALGKGK